MPNLDVSTPLAKRVPWLWRWKNSRRVTGIACFLPDCLTVVPRTTRGRQQWYCTAEHRNRARHRRTTLERVIRDLEETLQNTAERTPGVDRRKLESDLRYLRVCLLAYVVPTEAPPAKR
jgi:hypothetical protein